MNGGQLIAKERKRQREEEGFSAKQDDEWQGGQLAVAAACYATPTRLYARDERALGTWFHDPWPFDPGWDKRYRYGERRTNPGNVPADPDTYTDEERIDLLVKAGAFIAAEIDRLQRARRRKRKKEGRRCGVCASPGRRR